ncbi:MAG: UDP-N-acetylmuramoyl-L-alanyl-D-glutamate--2,6-diaminopimelate ligase [Gammaproteobacteria bacterium]|nr:UDP-N-acetylmuramoyl-L-alanyl-D-glutamate--2,6-diaminopimelate ligase [Gammaproteobacteria bacterium]
MTAQARSLSGVSLAQVMGGVAKIPPERDLMLQGLTLDSRRIRSGYLFLACRGQQHHGLEFMMEARRRGAVAVAYDPDGAVEYLASLRDFPAYAVRDLQQHAGPMAARFYADPSAAQTVIAVTGTNGKTSVSQIVAQALTGLGTPCGVLGTLGYGVFGDLEIPSHTTPDAVSVQGWLARFRDRGVQHVSMEASSHALDQGRLSGVHVAVAVFTNLTRDHLDYHPDMQSYGAAKRRLFGMPGLKHAVVNLDDDFGRQLPAGLSQAIGCTGYTLEPGRVFAGKLLRATHVSLHAGGTRFDVEGSFGTGHVQSRLLGAFNVGNLLAVLGVLLALEVPFGQALRVIENAQTVPGRMECFGGGGRPLVVVDYAHTPDALEKALQVSRAHCRGLLSCVFGCGGERDRGKRAQMGAIAARLADKIILTDDNPRHENGDAIIREILAGIGAFGGVQIQRDRARAVRQAVESAAAGDVVLVAGKGHETYQVVGDEQLAYSDRETVAGLLRQVTA